MYDLFFFLITLIILQIFSRDIIFKRQGLFFKSYSFLKEKSRLIEHKRQIDIPFMYL